MKTLWWIVILLVVILGAWWVWSTVSPDNAIPSISPSISESQNEMPEDMDMTPTPSETESESVTGTEDSSGVVQISVSGRNFAFDKNEIRVTQGDRVKITFTSESGFHDWVVDEFKAATEKVQTGGTTSVEFVADKKGTFQYYCSVGTHRQMGMVGNLIVE